ncbi:hypothetical protein PPROV_000002600 [Pycnococcus provasolii]|uniref:Amidase domain-containing protein n=1 Tax=Pycnococcus provasolii TaxID=41880 RepID=A0A830H5H7_9CHLO|nr:hypothetical protein PPROV_000002600 [Pycnococcus provasolii]
MIPGRTRLGSRLVLTGAARNNTRTHACFTLARTTYRAMATAAAATNRSSADSATYSEEALHVPTQNNEGCLANLSFAVKDCFDVKGAPTGFGNPTWLATHAECPQTHADAVRILLSAGACIDGKTHMDELAYSLNGENAHYGTPVNVAAPARIPGGSSSGSATAAARGDVSFALGTDTGGSVRTPAAYQGIFGLRPTHGRVSLAGCRPLAPSFDTPGILAKDFRTFHAASLCLIGCEKDEVVRELSASDDDEQLLPPLVWVTDAFDMLCSRETQDTIVRTLADAGIVISDKRPLLDESSLTTWDDALSAFRHLQAMEIWEEHGAWIEENQPNFGPGTSDRFAMARDMHAELATSEGVSRKAASQAARDAMTEAVKRLVPAGGAIVIPTAPGPAPLKATPPDALNAFRNDVLKLTMVCGLSRAPQVTLPAGLTCEANGPPGFPGEQHGEAPVGVSVIGAPGDDVALLRVASKIAQKIALSLK